MPACGGAGTVGGVKIALAILLALVLAGPAAAADRVVHEFGQEGLDYIDAYGGRVAWTQGPDDDDGDLWTLERGVAVKVDVKPVVEIDVTEGPRGRPVVVYTRCPGKRPCTFYMYDFKTRRESRIKGAPKGGFSNWSFWRDRFAVIRGGRFVVAGLDGRTQDVGRARSLADRAIDFNGAALSYINNYEDYDDHIVYELAYFPVQGKGKILKRAAHGASGELSLDDARVDGRYGYVVQTAGEFGGANRLWRVDLKSGVQQYTNLPGLPSTAMPLGDKQVLVHACHDEDELDCDLTLALVRYRDR
jgi:hypothetical protein